MRIIIPKESYPLEKRIMLLPDAVKRLVQAGHDVFVQSEAAMGIHISDEAYVGAGAKILSDAESLYGLADLVVKLKAPSPEEFSLMHDAILFSMFHSEQNPSHIYYAGRQGLTVVEMESIRDNKNERIVDQTDITGQEGVYYALRHRQKIPDDMKALILGYGSVSRGAINACARLGMRIKILRKKEFPYLSEHLKDTDLLINGISWPKKYRDEKRYLVTREDIQRSATGMIVLDLSVDFPNPIETIHPTTYAHPYYIEEDHVHISIYGYPGLVPVTSSNMYSQRVEPLVFLIANNGGLERIKEQGDLGKYVERAIVDPKRLNWRQYAPAHADVGSNIE